MRWTVVNSKKVEKTLKRLPRAVQDTLIALQHEIEIAGPVRGNWPNYGKLEPGVHHCHLKKGKPTYVAIWEEEQQGIRLVEVLYVGTHEKAPY